MAENKKHTFINYDPSNPRPTRPQRQAVSTYIGKHFRNRSAPAQRKHSHLTGSRAQAPLNTSRLAGPIRELSDGDDGGPRPHSLISVEGVHDIHYLAARLTDWGTGPTPFMRCWVQMVCGDMTLFDSVAAFTHGVRITTLENQVTPSATMLWHKTRAIRGLQAKISTDTEDREITWKASETILATFYLMEGAARFGYESEFKSHCLGLLRMMQLRGEVVSACLKDLYVVQAVGLVEGTEMASELTNVDSHNGFPSSRDAQAVASASAFSMETKLRYPYQGLHHENPLWVKINASPAGFHDLIMLGDLSIEFILLLDELLGSIDREQLQQHSSITEATERQVKMVKQARLLEKESDNAAERLACLGVIMFLTRRISQMKMFPEVTFIDKLTTLGRQMFHDPVGTSCYNDLRIWATLIGVEIMATAGATLKQRTHEAARELLFIEGNTDGWDDVERIAKRYLWDEKSLAAWKKYWMSCRDMS
ncbi:hypothetical protein FMUND_12967 [Fusarium mundagurra]|uniref:Uncharacterized protein n=1 Tax=Fusarium mundagurra TaxID=1567541 RepID=A0A8H5Y240_9HYPO|nr:hypothetical protein FMUND_12967 [Fusarium mundagurra]